MQNIYNAKIATFTGQIENLFSTDHKKCGIPRISYMSINLIEGNFTPKKRRAGQKSFSHAEGRAQNVFDLKSSGGSSKFPPPKRRVRKVLPCLEGAGFFLIFMLGAIKL